MKEIFPQTAARVEEWKARPEVLGVILVGSRSRGHSDEMSDDDLEVVLTGEAHARLGPEECSDLLIEGEGPTRKIIYDAEYISLPYLQGKVSSPIDLDHWPYERAPVLFDRDGSVTEAVRAVGRMDPDFRHKRLLHSTIDAWVPPYRAGKSRKRGHEAATRLLIARGVMALTRLIFALEWRWVPLDHWWEAELRTLDDPDRVGPDLVRALNDAEPKALSEALARLEDRLHAEGVPRAPDRNRLFFELIHPERREERAIFGMR
jgi:hypothetical protein